MKRFVLLCIPLVSGACLFAQTDSAQYFLKIGLAEKQKGRRMESLKNFEKAFKYDSTNKVVLNELASAYIDLRKYYQAKDTYKRLISVGETTPSNYKELLLLSFNLKAYDDALLYAGVLRKAAPSEKVSY